MTSTTSAQRPLAVGDLVVYASHGIGRVESIEAGRAGPETVVLAFETGLRVTLPLARTGEALRALSSPEELEQVRRTLCADVPPSTEPWSSRQRATREKLAAGTVTGLAEVVRDGLQRERIYAARKGGRLAGPSERELYLQARKLLAAEIALSRGIDVAAADDWIAEQVGDSPGETDSAT